MKKLTLKNNNITKLDNAETTVIKITNNNSVIGSINIYNAITIFSGFFNNDLNIFHNSYIYLDNDFILLNSSINLMNSDDDASIHIYGELDILNENIIINSSPNLDVTLYISSLNSSNHIKYNCLSPSSSTDSFRINRFNKDSVNLENMLPINLSSPEKGSLNLNIDVNELDFASSEDLSLLITPETKVNNFINIKPSTFKGISADTTTIGDIKSSSPYPLPIEGVLLRVTLNNGEGSFSILNELNPKEPPSASVLLGNSEYILSN